MQQMAWVTGGTRWVRGISAPGVILYTADKRKDVETFHVSNKPSNKGLQLFYRCFADR